MDVVTRFLKYVSFDTQSDDKATSKPSSEKQLVLGRALEEELKDLGLLDVYLDQNGNVFGTIPANTDKTVPAVGFLAHMDTSPDASGANVKARIVEAYDGGDVELGSGVVLSPSRFPFLKELKGEHLIVTDGTTLLGADDKAGIAEIMAMAETLLHTDRPHGVVKVAFTTDEEVGAGTENFDVAAFGCTYGYTVDGGPLGELEYDNFNAASAAIEIRGVGVHPGSAKNIMKNAIRIGLELDAMLPAEQRPEYTENREGFFHLCDMNGATTGASMLYIIRDHDMQKFEEKKKLIASICDLLNLKYGAGTVTLTLRDSYYNMLEIIRQHPHLIDRAAAAFRKNAVEPKIVPIRGGTDGAMLSHKGLPCPNLSTGGYNYHGVYEFIPVRALETMPKVLVDLACSFAEGE